MISVEVNGEKVVEIDDLVLRDTLDKIIKEKGEARASAALLDVLDEALDPVEDKLIELIAR